MRSILFRSAMLLVCLLICDFAHAGGSDLSNTRLGFYYGEKAAPVLGTTVEVRVTGVIARTRVTQIFKNPNQTMAGGTYIFRLPEAAAVTAIRIMSSNVEAPASVEEKITVTLAEALVKAGNLKEAEAEYVQSLVQDPTDEETWRGLEALGRLAGFTVNRQVFGSPCSDASAAPAPEAVERTIQQRVIVR